jgi:hypothetical protein
MTIEEVPSAASPASGPTEGRDGGPPDDCETLRIGYEQESGCPSLCTPCAQSVEDHIGLPNPYAEEPPDLPITQFQKARTFFVPKLRQVAHFLMELARNAGWGEPLRQQERYYNSGFAGLHIEHRAYLNT